MQFLPNEIYHVYNRGNNKQTIFFNDDNYVYFLRKVRKEWLPYCDILCYCLMPNHFHFMLSVNESGCEQLLIGKEKSQLQKLSKVIGDSLSSYTRIINKNYERSGSLFQKKTKAKLLSEPGLIKSKEYISNCLFYIHQNPVTASLTKKATDWEFSSAKDYAELRNGTLCNKELLYNRSILKHKDFLISNTLQISQEEIQRFY